MAGLPINYIQEQLQVENPIARIMPNTNAVGHSVTLAFKTKRLNDLKVNAFGSVEVDEDHLHQVTAITGSGPAFYIMSLNNMLKQVQI